MITWAGHPVRRLGIVGRVLVIMPHENSRQRATRHDSLVRGEVGVQDKCNGAEVSRERMAHNIHEAGRELLYYQASQGGHNVFFLLLLLLIVLYLLSDLLLSNQHLDAMLFELTLTFLS